MDKSIVLLLCFSDRSLVVNVIQTETLCGELIAVEKQFDEILSQHVSFLFHF